MLSRFFIALSVLTLMFAGCSSPNPSVPDSPANSEANGPIDALSSLTDSVNEVLMSGTMIIDPETGEAEVVNGRIADWNFNITSFLAGGCPGGCFSFRIVNIVGTVLEIELKLINPSALQAYDVKLVYEKLYNKKVLNPTSFTDIFKAYNIRPFTAFASEYPNMAFPIGPGSYDTETLFLNFPPGSPVNVDFIIVASYPSNTLEPYKIHSMMQSGDLTPLGGSAVFSCVVEDHQQDISAVLVDTRVFMGTISNMWPDPLTPGLYTVNVSNTLGVPVGSYSCIIKANSPDPQNTSTYNYLIANVTEESNWKPIEVVHLSGDNFYSVDPDVAFDSNGKAHIIWTEVDHTGYMLWNQNIWYSNNVDGYWSAPIELSDAFQNDNDYIVSASAIAINNQDHICVVWPQCLYNGDRSKIWWNYYDGRTWKGQTQMFERLTNIEVQPQLCSDDAFFYMAFRHGSRSGEIMFSRLENEGTWRIPVPISDPIDMEYELQFDGRSAITAACRGGIFVTWLFYDMNPEGKWVIKWDQSWDGGAVWGPDLGDISDTNYNAVRPSIALGGGSNLYELWIEDDKEVRWDKYEGGSWGTDKILFKSQYPIYPAFDVMRNSGHQHVCYIDPKLFPSPLYYTESTDGVTWSDAIVLTPNEGECEMPSVATWGTSKVGVTWKQHLESYTNDILYREKEF